MHTHSKALFVLLVSLVCACSSDRERCPPGRTCLGTGDSSDPPDGGTPLRDASAAGDVDAGIVPFDGGTGPYEPDCERRVSSRPPDPRIGTATIVLDPSLTGAARDAFCAGSGGVLVDIGPESTRLTGTDCRGRLAREAFRFGVCSCTDLVVHESANGTGTVGANGAFSARDARLGQVVVGGCGGIGVDTSLEVASNVETNGPLAASGVGVGRDLWVASSASGTGRVERSLYRAPDAVVASSISVGESTFVAPVDVAPPCVCDGSFADDIVAAADRIAAAPDERVDTFVETMEHRTFTCGRYLWSASPFPYYSEIVGRVVIVVRGDLIGVSGTVFELHEGSSLVLIVTGSLRTSGNIVVGDATGSSFDAFIAGDLTSSEVGLTSTTLFGPERGRWYIAGREVTTVGGTTVLAQVYAPNADFVVDHPDVSRHLSVTGGSLVARSVRTDHLEVTAPAAPPDIGSCDEPEGGCESCADCAADAACIDGACGPCSADADCCGALICFEGQCVPDLI